MDGERTRRQRRRRRRRRTSGVIQTRSTRRQKAVNIPASLALVYAPSDSTRSYIPLQFYIAKHAKWRFRIVNLVLRSSLSSPYGKPQSIYQSSNVMLRLVTFLEERRGEERIGNEKAASTKCVTKLLIISTAPSFACFDAVKT